MNNIKLLTVELKEGHRGEFKLFVNEGIRGNVSDVLEKLKENQKPGDCNFDLCSLYSIRGEFTLLRTSHRDASNNAVRDILNENSGMIRIRLGEILSFKIFDGPFIRVWVTFDGSDSKVSWGIFDSGKIEPRLAKHLECAVRIREGKVQAVAPVRTHSLENAFSQSEKIFEDWSPSETEVATPNLHVVNKIEAKSRKTPRATRAKRVPKIADWDNVNLDPAGL